MRWLRQHLIPLKHDTDILAFGMFERILVVLDVARLSGVDGVVAAHAHIVAWKPLCAALAEDDVAWDYVLFWEEESSSQIVSNTHTTHIGVCC
jgi:hypothetical protein